MVRTWTPSGVYTDVCLQVNGVLGSNPTVADDVIIPTELTKADKKSLPEGISRPLTGVV
jgi:hypothetical protein